MAISISNVNKKDLNEFSDYQEHSADPKMFIDFSALKPAFNRKCIDSKLFFKRKRKKKRTDSKYFHLRRILCPPTHEILPPP